MVATELPTAEPKRYPCSVCGRYSENTFMCEECAQRTEPKRKDKKGAAKWTAAAMLAAIEEQLGDTLRPGWTGNFWDIVNELVEREVKRGERIDWIEKNWRRRVDFLLWLDSLDEQDAARIYSDATSKNRQYEKEPGPKGYPLLRDDIEVSNRRWERHIEDPRSDIRNDRLIELATFAATQFGYIPDGRGFDERALKQASRMRFFAAVATLSDDDYATLQVYVHQKRAQRDRGNERAFTSKTAAAILSKRLGKAVSPATYRKRVERMKKALGRDVDVFIKYRLL